MACRYCSAGAGKDWRFCDMHLATVRGLRVGASEVHGNGLFTTRKFRAGDTIDTYEADVITEAQLIKRYGLNKRCTYTVELQDGTLVDALYKKPASSYANGSLGNVKPNATLDDDLVLTALVDIPANVEVFWAYGERYWEPEE
jgi:hypothetical protein